LQHLNASDGDCSASKRERGVDCRLYQSAGGAPEGGAPGGFPEGGEAPPSGGGSGSGPKIEEVD
jgi:hypothetical protein